MNRLTIIGYVGKDPDIRSTKDGKRVANFSVATTETWKDKATGEKKEKTEWHRCVCWVDGLITIIERYVKKGTRLLVERQVTTRNWDDDGVEKYTTECQMTGFNAKLMLLSTKEQDASASRSAPAGAEASSLDDDIPF